MANPDKHYPKRPAADESRKEPAADPLAKPDPQAGMNREVGDLEDPDAVENDGALPGRMGGGLAGG